MNIQPDEQMQVRQIIQRDEKALYSLYKKYEKPLFYFVNRQLKDPHVSEEIVQDAFLDFIETLRDFRFQCSLKTFLFSIAKNKVIDTIRKKKIKKILFSALPTYVVEGLKTILIDDEIEKTELQHKIKKVLDELPNDYHVVLRLKYMEGDRVRTIARKLSLGFKATESLIFRARKAFVRIFKSLP
ncbi:hypothetical protein COT62_03285 [Candidatus Roizmanbacteria bacterium CG09_land_8_20_14_0_10_41_9]|uniref:RNA polymerase sigma-70 region 2 domain-containing protein n=1 Tax=Candidatus Roizmanbacteria bacterium CG09_land_8_20_14_0_10_41_9 TaxID=1974850 RepID=A0A2H0WS64_9BACT|nr:MAG: hypothetical protein COT62_03285 [Candidatus Roizmanbacteria bacterium CG09_land_8_20_14_0_10_41_9]